MFPNFRVIMIAIQNLTVPNDGVLDQNKAEPSAHGSMHSKIVRVCSKSVDIFGKITKLVLNILQIPLLILGYGNANTLSSIFDIGKKIHKGSEAVLVVDKCRKRISRTGTDGPTLSHHVSDLKLILSIVSKVGIMPAELCPIFALVKHSVSLYSDTEGLTEDAKLLIECKRLIANCDNKMTKWNEKRLSIQNAQNGNIEELDLLIMKYRSKIEYFYNHKQGIDSTSTESESKVFKYIQILDGLENARFLNSAKDLRDVTEDLNRQCSEKIQGWTTKKVVNNLINNKSIFSLILSVTKIAATVLSVISVIFLLAGASTSFAIPLLCAGLTVSILGIAKLIFDYVNANKIEKLAIA